MEEDLFADLQEGHTNEVLIPMKIAQKSPNANSISRDQLKRYTEVKHSVHLPNQVGWLYLKIHCGYITASKLLLSQLSGFTQQLVSEQELEKWFFVRYQDHTGQHLRVRFLSANAPLIMQRVNNVLGEYIREGKIRVSYDSYLPETRRYGGEAALRLCESIFCEDTLAVLQNLRVLEEQKGEDRSLYMIELAMKNIRYLLGDFGYTPEQCIDLIGQLEEGFAQEFEVQGEFRKALSKKYRTYQSFVDNSIGSDESFRQRSINTAKQIQGLKVILANNGMVTINEIFASISHMSLNRFFGSMQREQEFVTYNFLLRRLKAEFYGKR